MSTDMASATTTDPAASIPTAGPGFDPIHQTIYMLYADGSTVIPVPLSQVDDLYARELSNQASFGTQLGASIMVLVVLLLMTPKNRYRRAIFILNTSMLALNVVYRLLICLFFTSRWIEFYMVFSGDYSSITTGELALSASVALLAVPLVMVIESALALQAWSMLRLWPAKYKWPAATLSLALVLAVMGLRMALAIYAVENTLYNNVDPSMGAEVQKAELALRTTSVCWFCALFMARLAAHLWTNRTVLPDMRGVSAMEALVMTNGVLMLIPVLFAGLEFGSFVKFEASSLALTSVVVVLPLGTLIAQRLANPHHFARDNNTITPTVPRTNNTTTPTRPLVEDKTGAWQGTTASKQDRYDLELAKIDDEEMGRKLSE